MPKSALQTTNKPKPKRKSYYKPITTPDKRTKNGNKIDLTEVIKLRDVQGLSFPKIGSILNLTPQYIQRSYDKFKALIHDTDISKAFQDNRTNILNTLEFNLLQDLGSADKREKASLNNVAYAFNQIHTARRLEQGLSTGNVAISIETVYQDAEKAAKLLRKDHGVVQAATEEDE